MIFSSNIFLFVFLPVTVLIYYSLKKLPIIWRNVWLLIASLFFYAWGEPEFVLVMLLSIVVNYGFGLWVDKVRDTKAGRWIVALMLFFNLAILFYHKYMNFVTRNLSELTGGKVAITNILLPIGISFFTFQAISYVIDVYRGNAKVQKNPLYVGLYIALFPQLVAGPIVRYETIAEQIVGRKEKWNDFCSGVERFVRGFLKKVLISNVVALAADDIFGMVLNKEPVGMALAWVGAIAYTLQIYYDFSGYSDMAIGLGRMFGFQFKENFNAPYFAESITDFWRRWHISLSSWFRDYVYIPLGGSRVNGKIRLLFNLFVVWTLTGIWHGAEWTFLFWGLFYFVLLAFEKLTGLPKRFNHKVARGGYRVFTMVAVIAAWVIFRAESIRVALRYLLSMAGSSGLMTGVDLAVFYLREYWYIWIIAILYLKWETISDRAKYQLVWLELPLFIYAVSNLVIDAYNPFIYFNF